MKTFNRPPITEPANFDTFIKYRQQPLRTNLKEAKKVVSYRYNKYKALMPEVQRIHLHKVDKDHKDALSYIYHDYTCKAVKTFRKTLFDHVPKCPYCGIDSSVHLDHYLPKGTFPEFYLYSLNLIPICEPCNTKYKKAIYSKNGFRVFIHPYHDQLNAYEFLKATLSVQMGVVKIDYRVIQAPGISHDMFHVIKRHFKELQLQQRYLKHATTYLGDMKDRWTGNVDVRRRSLESSYRDALAEYGYNHWKTALLKNAYTNTDFIVNGIPLL